MRGVAAIRRRLGARAEGPRERSGVRGMRRKITGVAMVAVVAVLVVVIAGMNVINWLNMCDRLDGVMDYVEQTDGDLDQLDYDSDAHADLSTLAYEDLLEMRYDARYFTVELDGDGEPVGSNLNSIVSISNDEAAEMARDVWARKGAGSDGFEGSYRYRIVTDGGVSRIFFLYSYGELEAFQAFLHGSILMGLIGLAAFAAIVVPFSRTATRPVEEAQERQRRFVTDASHELRTPISIIQSAVDVIEIEGGESQWTASIHNQTKRLEDLTNKLVALAKAEEGGRSLQLADVDVSEMALQIAEDFEPVAQDQGKPLATDIAQDLHCQADAGMLGQSVSILLDNAFKHSPDGSPVTFSVGRPAGASGRGRVRIAVSNDAGDVPEGAHPEFFGRFYKADRSRAYEQGSGGHGIGLAVVKAVAEAHGGSAEAVCAEGRVTISLTL